MENSTPETKARILAGRGLEGAMSDTHAQQMFRIVTGYWGSQIVGALARLGIADCLADGPQDSESVARRIACDMQGTLRLMRAAVALGIAVRNTDGRFVLTQLGRTLISSAPDSMRDNRGSPDRARALAAMGAARRCRSQQRTANRGSARDGHLRLFRPP